MGGYLYFDATVATAGLCEWVQVRTDVYVTHCKYQVKPHAFPWFLA